MILQFEPLEQPGFLTLLSDIGFQVGDLLLEILLLFCAEEVLLLRLIGFFDVLDPLPKQLVLVLVLAHLVQKRRRVILVHAQRVNQILELDLLFLLAQSYLLLLPQLGVFCAQLFGFDCILHVQK